MYYVVEQLHLYFVRIQSTWIWSSVIYCRRAAEAIQKRIQYGIR